MFYFLLVSSSSRGVVVVAAAVLKLAVAALPLLGRAGDDGRGDRKEKDKREKQRVSGCSYARRIVFFSPLTSLVIRCAVTIRVVTYFPEIPRPTSKAVFIMCPLFAVIHFLQNGMNNK